jgi:type I restriction enzyme S subunit
MTTETFFANFGHLADAPNGVQKLRELILQLAVQGKLVPQNSIDEPAYALIGKILKTNGKGLSLGNEPFLLPKSWLWVKFGDISVIERGGSPRPIKDYMTDEADGLNWIKIGDTDMGGKYISSTKEKICKEGLKKTRMVYPGDFLLTNSMSFGRPYITQIEGCIHDGWLRIHPPEVLDKDYLYNLLSSPYVAMFFKGAAAGAVVSNLNTGKVRELPIPLPPLEEQKRIVTKVDQLMALCNELEVRQQKQQQGRVRLNSSALDALLTAREPDEFADHWQRITTNFDLLYDHPETIAKLRAAILQLAVQGKLVPQDPNDEPASVLLGRIQTEKEALIKEGALKISKNPSKLNADENLFLYKTSHLPVRLLDVCLVVTDGDHQPPPKTESGIPFLVIGNVRSGQVDFTGSRFVSSEYFNNLDPIRVPKKGDILYTVVGSYGIPVAVSTDDEFCVQRHIAIIKPSTLIDPNYLRYSLSSESAFDQATACATGIAQKTVPLSGLRNIWITLPPFEEQKRIVTKVDQLMALCDELETKLNQARQHSEKLMEATVRQLLGTSTPQKPHTAGAPVAPATSKSGRPARHAYQPAPAIAEPIAAETAVVYGGSVPETILAAMQPGQEYSRAAILAATSIREADWMWAIKQLKEQRRVAQSGEKRGARYRLK